MKTIEKQIEDWERITEIKKLAKVNEGALKKSFYTLAYQKVKEYNEEYKIKYDPLNKPK